MFFPRFVHNKERPFKCLHCDYSTYLKARLAAHMKSRSCPGGKDRAANTAEDGRHVCEQCGAKYGEKRFLTLHKMKKHGRV